MFFGCCFYFYKVFFLGCLLEIVVDCCCLGIVRGVL